MSEYWYNRLKLAAEVDGGEDYSEYDNAINDIEHRIQYAGGFLDRRITELDKSISAYDDEKVVYVRGGGGSHPVHRYTWYVYCPIQKWRRALNEYECQWLGFNLINGRSEEYPYIKIGSKEYDIILSNHNNHYQSLININHNQMMALHNKLNEVKAQKAQKANAQKRSNNRAWWNVYHEYIQSDEWKEKRAQVLERDNWTCQECGAGHKAILQAHHTTYFNVGDEPLRDLITLCKLCHDRTHGREL